MHSRGQATVEFMIILAVLFVALLFSFSVFGEKQSGFILSKEKFNAQLEADKIARAANTVFLAGAGAKTTIVLEKSFGYTVVFSGNAVNVKWGDNFSGAALLTSSITAGAIASGSTISIENAGEGIKIETI